MAQWKDTKEPVVVYDGFRPGETRTQKMRARKIDGGHSVVELRQRRAGHDFRFHYRIRCECGKLFKSTQTVERAIRSHTAHMSRELSR